MEVLLIASSMGVLEFDLVVLPEILPRFLLVTGLIGKICLFYDGCGSFRFGALY